MNVYVVRCIFFILFSLSLNGQSLKISKIVVDDKTKQPIENGSIYNDKDFSSTNSEGAFVFVSEQDKICLIALGYDILCTSFEQLRKSDTIFMKSKAILLDEVIVSDTQSLMGKVYGNLHKNYVFEPYTEQFFLRCILKMNTTTTRLQDIYGKVYRNTLFRKEAKIKNEYSIEILNMRKAGVLNDRSLEYFEFLDFKQLFSWYATIFTQPQKYDYTELKSFDDDYYKVHFVKNEENKEFQTRIGYYIINKKDFAITHVTYKTDENIDGTPYVKNGGIKYRTLSNELSVNFRKDEIKEKYYISHASLKQVCEIIRKDTEKVIYEITYDLLTTNPFMTEKVKSNFSESKDIFKINVPYSEDFWESQNQLPLTEELKKFLEIIPEEKNKKQEFRFISNF